MPYCSQCGNQVATSDVYCAICGTRQPVTPPPPAADPLATMTPRTASMLCYIPVVGWIAAIILLLLSIPIAVFLPGLAAAALAIVGLGVVVAAMRGQAAVAVLEPISPASSRD